MVNLHQKIKSAILLGSAYTEWSVTSYCAFEWRARRRWNRGTGHRETWQGGTRWVDIARL